MKWLRKLFGLCEHKWKILEKINVYEVDDNGTRTTKNPTYSKYVLQCQNCGDLRTRKI